VQVLGVDFAFDVTRLLVVGVLAAARVLPIFTLAPFFGGRLVPPLIRIAVSLAFVAVLFPGIDAATPDLSALGPVTLGALLFKEVAMGLVLGFLASIPFWAVEAAGRLADTARGANMAEVLVPQTGTQSSPLGDLGLQLAIVLFFALGGHLLFLRSLAASYEAIPLAGFPAVAAFGGVADLAVRATAQLILSTLGLAAPVLAALFLADLALGLVNRVSPQIQVYFLGMPAKALLGVLVFLLALGGMILAIRGELAHALDAVRRAVGLLQP